MRYLYTAWGRYARAMARDMNDANAQAGDFSRGLLLSAFIIAFLLLGFVVATAVRNNPLYSDRDTYGLSKYKFIELCKKELDHPENIMLPQGGGNIVEALKGQGMLDGDKKVKLDTSAIDAKVLVDGAVGVEVDTGRKLAGKAVQEKVWQMSIPTELQIIDGAKKNILTTLPFTCQGKRENGKNTVTVSLPAM